MKDKVERISISLQPEVANKLKEIVKVKNYANRSKFISDLIVKNHAEMFETFDSRMLHIITYKIDTRNLNFTDYFFFIDCLTLYHASITRVDSTGSTDTIIIDHHNSFVENNILKNINNIKGLNLLNHTGLSI